jgi:hypothetical protein
MYTKIFCILMHIMSMKYNFITVYYIIMKYNAILQCILRYLTNMFMHILSRVYTCLNVGIATDKSQSWDVSRYRFSIDDNLSEGQVAASKVKLETKSFHQITFVLFSIQGTLTEKGRLSTVDLLINVACFVKRKKMQCKKQPI